MKPITFISIVLIFVGVLLFTGCSAENRFDWSRLSIEKFEQKTYTTEESFQSISVEEEYGINVKLLPSADGVCKIEYPESKRILCEISVENDTLKIKQLDNRRWYHMIGINVYTPTLTVYLPERELQTLNIEAGTSDISIPEDFTFESLKIQLSTGDVTSAAHVTGELSIEVSTGDITVSSCTPTSVNLTSSTGEISAVAMHATGDLYAKSSTGNQSFRDVTCANATLISSTGDKELNAFTASGSLTVESDTGDQTYTNITCGDATLISTTGDKTISNLTGFGNLTVQSDTGDDTFYNVVCNQLKVTTSTGHQTYTDVSCGATDLFADTGKIRMTNLVSSELLKIKTDTGDITFDRCDAATLDIEADTGSVTGTLRTPKIFYAESDSGRVRVPHSTEGELCEIKTDTGKITIDIVQA